MLRILVLQTCDGPNYGPLLDYSQPKHEAYCRKHGYDYMRWDGLKKAQGNYPGFAIFNKIYLLKEILKTTTYDWVVYLDAAAIILDTERPMEEFLHLNKVMVSSSISAEDKNICDISFSLYNMNHPKLQILLDEWQQSFETNLERDKTNQFKNGWPNFKSYNDLLLLNDILKKKQSYAFLYNYNYFTNFIGVIKRQRNMPVKTRLELLQELRLVKQNTLDSPPLVPQVQQVLQSLVEKEPAQSDQQ